jgi:thiol-disulfide isomerase/thioredoxin
MSGPPRRQVLIGAGLAAGALGLGLAVWQGSNNTAPGKIAQPKALSPAANQFWASRFERPDGAELVAAELRGRPLVLNFWATWCAPCVKELPELDQFQREFQDRGWQVIGLAVDRAEPVREFLKKLPLDFPVAMAGLAGLELSRSLGNTQGGLPFSVAFGRDGEARWRKLGATDLSELRKMAAAQG